MRLRSPKDFSVQPQHTVPIVARPALLVVDMQNDFVRAGAPFEVPAARETIPPQQRLLDAFRAHGLPIVFLKWIGVENDPYRHMQDKFTWARGLAEDIKDVAPDIRVTMRISMLCGTVAPSSMNWRRLTMKSS
jgi:isochorismate hydrolase